MEIDLGNGSVALIDDCDFDAIHTVELARGLFWQESIANIGWRAKRRKHTSYAVATLAKQIELTDAEISDIVDKFTHGVSQRELAKQFNVPPTTLKRILRSANAL